MKTIKLSPTQAKVIKPVYKNVEVKLNSEYTAIIYENDVKVGCQHFGFKEVKEVYEAVIAAEKWKNENK
jgi:hypothetical protein